MNRIYRIKFLTGFLFIHFGILSILLILSKAFGKAWRQDDRIYRIKSLTGFLFIHFGILSILLILSKTAREGLETR